MRSARALLSAAAAVGVSAAAASGFANVAPTLLDGEGRRFGQGCVCVCVCPPRAVMRTAGQCRATGRQFERCVVNAHDGGLGPDARRVCGFVSRSWAARDGNDVGETVSRASECDCAVLRRLSSPPVVRHSMAFRVGAGGSGCLARRVHPRRHHQTMRRRRRRVLTLSWYDDDDRPLQGLDEIASAVSAHWSPVFRERPYSSMSADILLRYAQDAGMCQDWSWPRSLTRDATQGVHDSSPGSCGLTYSLWRVPPPIDHASIDDLIEQVARGIPVPYAAKTWGPQDVRAVVHLKPQGRIKVAHSRPRSGTMR